MSVIIRLQGLPWSASAMDIRTYFHGLSIPEGGVHIVGGELGDAFIAFANDEDARQAMLMDSRRIKDCRVKLLLSSRAEMQKVIDAARTRNMVMQGLVPPTAVAAPPTPTPAMTGGIGAMMMPGALHHQGVGTAMTGEHPMMAAAMHGAAALTPQQQQMMYVNRMMHPQYMQQQQPHQQQQFPPSAGMDPYMSANAMAQQHGGVTAGDYGSSMMMKPVNAAVGQSAFMGAAGVVGGGQVGSNMGDQALRQRENHQMMPQQSPMSGSRDTNNRDRDSLGGGGGTNGDATKRGGGGSNDDRSGRRGGERDAEPDRDRFRDRGGRRRERSRSPRRRSRSRERDGGGFNRNRDRFGGERSSDRGVPDYTRGAGMDTRRSTSQGRPDLDGPFRSQSRERGSSRGGGGGMSQDVDSRSGGGGGGSGRMLPPRGGMKEDVPDRERPPFQNGRVGESSSMPIVLDDSPRKKDAGGRSKSSRVSRWGGDADAATATASSDDRGRGNSSGGRPSGPESRDDSGFRRQQHPVGGQCLIMRNVPFNACMPGIRDYFGGLPIPADGVRLPLDDRGRRLPVALIRFADMDTRQVALRRDKQMLYGSIIDLMPVPDEEFTNVNAFVSETGNHSSGTGGGNNEQQRMGQSSPNQHGGGRRHHQMSPPPSSDRDGGGRRFDRGGRGGDGGGGGGERSDGPCVYMKGLPFSCREGDIIHFFKGFKLSDVLIEFDHVNNRARGTGYVEFETPGEARRSMSLDGGMIGRRYIELIQVPKADMVSAQNQQNEDGLRHGPPRGFGGGGDMRNGPRSGGEDGHREEGPPRSSQHSDDDIQRDEFSPADCCLVNGLPPDAIDRDLLEFFAPVNVVPTAIHLMLNPSGSPHGHAFCEFGSVPDCKRALMQNGAPVRPGSRLTLGVSSVTRRELEHTVGKGPSRGKMLPSMPGPFGGGSGGGSMSPPPGDRFHPPGPFPHPRMPGRFHGGDHGPPFDRTPQKLGPAFIEQFGRPGCVVQLSNIPFRANVDDIINFFQEFQLLPKQIIRRFEEDRSPSGDARISFLTPADASTAIRQYNGKVMFGRPINMFLI